VSEARKKTTSRRELERNEQFEELSPEVGELNEEAVEHALDENPDDTMALLADLTGATDPILRELARRLAGRLFLDLSRRGPTRPRGVGKLQTRPYRPDGGDIDIDASIDALLTARDRLSCSVAASSARTTSVVPNPRSASTASTTASLDFVASCDLAATTSLPNDSTE
jgi:hypothetical protein